MNPVASEVSRSGLALAKGFGESSSPLIRAGHYRNGPGHVPVPHSHAGLLTNEGGNMLRKLYLVPVLALFAIPAVAHAQFEAGNLALTLSGSGQNDKDFRSTSFSVNGSLGFFLTKEMEIGVRQGVIYADGNGSSWAGQTLAAFDYHIDLDRWQPYLGVNAGYAYGGGSNHNDAWLGGPEVGVKYFVNATTFIDLNAAYEFDLQNGIDHGQFLYGLGLGVKF